MNRESPEQLGFTVAHMAEPDPERVRVSLRLKAGRYLAGRADDDGKPIALPVDELAKNPLLVANRITRNRLEEIEQTKTSARPMELEKIAVALGLPEDWFAALGSATQLDDAEHLLREAIRVARENLQAQEAEAAAGGARGRRRPGAGGGDA